MDNKLYETDNTDDFNMELLHIFGQEQWHDEAYITGTKEALIRLRDAIDNAINNDVISRPVFMTNDGEGYHIQIAKLPEIYMDVLKTPYTWEEALDTTGDHPYDVINNKFNNLKELDIFKNKDNKIYDVIKNKYEEPHRHYHNLNHIRYCFAVLRRLMKCSESIFPAINESLILAIWFHDIIYNPLSNTNEEDSVKFMYEIMGQYFDAKTLEEAENLILITKYDREPTTDQEKAMCDVDLAILASAWDEFCEYDKSIRMEYAQVPDEIYYKERAKILKKFLSKGTIFSTEAGKLLFENSAIKNINTLLANMEKLELLIDKT